MDTTILFSALGGLATQSPILIVWGIGVALCFTHWQEHTKIARATLIALCGFITLLIFNAVVTAWLPRLMMDSGNISLFLIIRGIGNSLLQAILWGILIWAIFAKRTPQATSSNK